MNRPSALARAVRCAGISSGAATVSFTLLATLTLTTSIPNAAAVVIADTVTAVPTYLLYRRWVWKNHDRSRLHREILHYWLMTLTVTALTAAAAATATAAFRPETRLSHAAVTLSADVLTGITLWFAQFRILDRRLHQHAETAAPVVERQPRPAIAAAAPARRQRAATQAA